MINNDNITSAENGVKSNVAEKEIMLCSVSWLILAYSMMSELRGKGDSQYIVRYWEYVRIMTNVVPHFIRGNLRFKMGLLRKIIK